tara:strand:+ start:648 stop:899 length:252 start_codon:yes stop_codon:yes gene_type:complete
MSKDNKMTAVEVVIHIINSNNELIYNILVNNNIEVTDRKKVMDLLSKNRDILTDIGQMAAEASEHFDSMFEKSIKKGMHDAQA